MFGTTDKQTGKLGAHFIDYSFFEIAIQSWKYSKNLLKKILERSILKSVENFYQWLNSKTEKKHEFWKKS